MVYIWITINEPKSRYFLVFLCLYTLGNSESISDKNIPSFSEPNPYLRVEDVKPALSEIIRYTNCSYSEFKERTLFFGLHREADLSLLYNDLYGATPDKCTPNKSILLVVKPSVPYTYTDFKPNCSKNITAGSFELCFYDSIYHEEMPRKNNIGNAYLPGQKALADISDSQNSYQTAPGNYLFYLNNCSFPEPSCVVYFQIKFLDAAHLKLTILGDPVAAPDQATNPAWVARLSDLKLNIVCKNKKSELYPYKNIGWELERNTFLAPYDEVFETDCVEPKQIDLSGRLDGIQNMYWHEPEKNFKISWDHP